MSIRGKLLGIAIVTSMVFCFGGNTPVQAQVSPGAEHAKLKALEGTWDALVKMGPGDPGSKATCEYKMDLGGLWLVSDFETSFGGMPFKGKGIDGFDAHKKKYTSVWVDSMTTAPLFLEGDFDATGKILTQTGTGIDESGKPFPCKMVTVTKDADHFTFTMYRTGSDGKETSMMTIDYTRRGAK